jgi:peptidoglycan LD-endopeptidase LytH
MSVSRGDVIAYVGISGDAGQDAPHLHLAIYRFGCDKPCRKGEPIDPYPILPRVVTNERIREEGRRKH